MHAAPGLARERAAWARGRLLFGIDEVGRGPLAGPVIVYFASGSSAAHGDHLLNMRYPSSSA